MKFAAVKVSVVSSVPLTPIAASVGASFTAVTVIVKVCGALAFVPPLATPPLSWAMTVTVAVPLELAAGVKVSVPDALTAGWTLNSPLLLFVTVKLTVCVDSSTGPAEMLVAKFATDCAPASSVKLRS